MASSFCQRLATLIVAVLPLAASGQTYVAGQSYFGRNGYIEYIPGNMPVMVSAAHGGSLKPAELPDRTYGTTVADSNTEDLARKIQQACSARFGGLLPHVIVCRLHREKIDCNREIVEGAQGNALTEIAWHEFQDFTAVAWQTITAQYGRGLYLDMHGHAHTLQCLELGYLLSATELALSDAVLDAGTYAQSTSIRNLNVLSPQSFTELLRGTGSLGGLLAARGYPSVPSPAAPNPGADPYFNGGYNTAQHGSLNGGTVSAVQIECNFTGVRDTAANRTGFSAQLASALEDYFTTHLALDLHNALPTISNITDRSIAVNTNTGAITFTINDAETAPASLTLTKASSNAVLVPAGSIVFGSSGANRTVTITPAANQLGTSNITVGVNDGTVTITDEWVLTVTGTAMETWRFANFGSTASTITSSDAANPDGDAWTNIQEYVLGTNPTVSGDTALLSVTASGANVTLSFVARQAMGPGYAGITRFYDLESTSDLTNPTSWAGVPGSMNIAGSEQMVTVVRPAGEAPKFYRLKVSLQ